MARFFDMLDDVRDFAAMLVGRGSTRRGHGGRIEGGLRVGTDNGVDWLALIRLIQGLRTAFVPSLPQFPTFHMEHVKTHRCSQGA
jgi:hypothetical protein